MSIHLNKKRQYDSPDMNDEQNNYSKKLQASPPSTIAAGATLQPVDPNTCHLKILIPSAAAGAIIGKGGEIIHAIREESGAKIHISDGSCPERVITVTGTTHAIFKVRQRQPGDQVTHSTAGLHAHLQEGRR